MLKIDIHTHILPKDIPDWKERFGYGGFITLEHHRSCCARMLKDDGHFFREIEDNCWSAERRIEECDKFGVNVQVFINRSRDVQLLGKCGGRRGNLEIFERRHCRNHRRISETIRRFGNCADARRDTCDKRIGKMQTNRLSRCANRNECQSIKSGREAVFRVFCSLRKTWNGGFCSSLGNDGRKANADVLAAVACRNAGGNFAGNLFADFLGNA